MTDCINNGICSTCDNKDSCELYKEHKEWLEMNETPHSKEDEYQNYIETEFPNYEN